MCRHPAPGCSHAKIEDTAASKMLTGRSRRLLAKRSMWRDRVRAQRRFWCRNAQASMAVERQGALEPDQIALRRVTRVSKPDLSPLRVGCLDFGPAALD